MIPVQSPGLLTQVGWASKGASSQLNCGVGNGMQVSNVDVQGISSNVSLANFER